MRLATMHGTPGAARPARPSRSKRLSQPNPPNRLFRTLAVGLLGLALLGSGCSWLPAPIPPAVLPPDEIQQGRLPRLADVFYQRIANRRFNSIATFHDPALREFFASRESFADYYAELAQALDTARFEANRPVSIEMIEFVPGAPNQVMILVHYTGENARPLRWWDSHMLREEQWEFRDGRWLIVPGKL